MGFLALLLEDFFLIDDVVLPPLEGLRRKQLDSARIGMELQVQVLQPAKLGGGLLRKRLEHCLGLGQLLFECVELLLFNAGLVHLHAEKVADRGGVGPA